MANFIWANDHQIINLDAVSVIHVQEDGKGGSVHLMDHEHTVILRGVPAMEFLSGFEGNRPAKSKSNK